jgi:hypothetical protein
VHATLTVLARLIGRWAAAKDALVDESSRTPTLRKTQKTIE